ncbi:MAG: ATP-dependent Clp protease adaptor ClpS [Proteobacteria bacterium]|nr:ATP-dependent Clp protease adaptor ClpS [Pseudomonadota bacterium]NBP14090.1 ATP-dependent Clp protease adaptor ClpS [bacterium]
METVTEKVVKKSKQSELKEPGKFKVVFCNDDVTPVEFVIAVLMQVFRHNQESAMDVTMKVHHTGSGIAGIYPFEIAEQKVSDATKIARNNGFPLIIKVEPE